MGSEEVDASDQRGFQDEVDLCLGAMTQLTKTRERERKRHVEKHQ